MAKLTIPETIELGDISVPLSANYQTNSSLFGKRFAFTAPTTIATVTDALRWQWAGFPDIAEVKATGNITIDSTGDTGQIITVFINDPFLGILNTGSYTLTDSDVSADIIASSLGSVLSANTYQYEIVVVNNVINITAAPETGALINGGNNIFVNITQIGFLADDLGDRIITQNNLNIITQ
jgi:hypothetical protein